MLFPQFAGVETELIVLITFVASVLIGGTAWEDTARLRQEAGAKAGRTTEERIRDARAQTCADSAMYREALAAAAAARGWAVHWYDRERVFRDAAAVLGCEDLDEFLRAMGRSIGPPWRAEHRTAAAAAIAVRERRIGPPTTG